MIRNLYIMLYICMLTSAIDAQQKKNTVAVLPFVNAGGVDKNEISIMTDRFNNFIVNTDVFTVLEREKMESILKEHDFTMTDNCNSSECVVQVGKLLGIERMVAGKIGKFGQVYTLDIRHIDVSTGQILKTKSDNYNGHKEGLLEVIEALAYTLADKSAPVRITSTAEEKSSIGNVSGKVSTNDTGDEIKIGKVEKKYGALEINCEMNGTLFIDGKKVGEVTDGSIIPIEKIGTGEHRIEIKSTDDDYGFEARVNVAYKEKSSVTAKAIKRLGKPADSFVDSRDGKTYKAVKIGNQTWMAENLNYATSSGSWCYGGNSSNCDKYGRLYDWETAKKVAPPGWHLPSKEEWETLLKDLGGQGSTAYSQMIPGGSSGFFALFGGWRYNGGNFGSVGSGANFWSSSENSTSSAWRCGVHSGYQEAYLDFSYKNYGFSVRCIKD